jgi:hypothetical protein
MNILLELKKQMAHNANETNLDINDVALKCHEGSAVFRESLLKVMEIVKDLTEKMPEEKSSLTSILNIVMDLTELHRKTIVNISGLMERQTEKTNIAIQEYKKAAEND